MTMLDHKKILDSTKISEVFDNFIRKPDSGSTKIYEIVEEFHENGIVLAMIFFSLPVAIPLPYPPGFTTIMGTPLIILSIQMLLGFTKVRLPRKINDYKIKNSALINISNKVMPTIKIVERYIRPRFGFAKSVYCEQFIGLISLICAISVAIPLPLTNAIPALAIAIMALGLLNRDGLVIIVGFITSIIGLIIAAAAMAASWAFIKYLFNLIF